jgi:protein associated with RNAse G/E
LQHALLKVELYVCAIEKDGLHLLEGAAQPYVYMHDTHNNIDIDLEDKVSKVDEGHL